MPSNSSMNSQLEARRLIISGQVQGVSFRAAMVTEARRHGARGWVRNLTGGQVEAVICGSGETVALMIAWARLGPPAASVTQVLVEEAQPEELADYEHFIRIASL